jgi:hypothetical protein
MIAMTRILSTLCAKKRGDDLANKEHKEQRTQMTRVRIPFKPVVKIK